MRKHHVFCALSGLAVLCLLCVLVLAAPTTTYGCGNIPQLQKEARAGNAEAQRKLGYCYDFGKGVAKDQRRAVELYQMAAEQGDAYGQGNLCGMYMQGLGGLPVDYRRAAEWCRKSAEQGNAHGQSNLGHLYEHGLGVPKDERRAVELYKKAAEQGDAGGRDNLGSMYALGKGGLPRDYRRALELFRMAAEQGDEGAYYNLGVMYEKGTGVPQSRTQAVEWYRKAARKDEERAKEALRDLGETW